MTCFYLKLHLHNHSNMQPQFFRSYGTHQIVVVIVALNIDIAVSICTRQVVVIVVPATRRGEPIRVTRDTKLIQSCPMLFYHILIGVKKNCLLRINNDI